MKTKFKPVDPDYYEIFSGEQEKEFSKIFFFGDGSKLKEATGKITALRGAVWRICTALS